jgi:hypothetical protein
MPEYARFVSVARFAKLVGLSERKCWVLIGRRDLPVYRIGRRTLVKAEEGFEAIEKLAEATASAQEH